MIKDMYNRVMISMRTAGGITKSIIIGLYQESTTGADLCFQIGFQKNSTVNHLL